MDMFAKGIEDLCAGYEKCVEVDLNLLLCIYVYICMHASPSSLCKLN